MASSLTLSEIIASLEKQIASHKEREAFHEEQRAKHVAEAEALSRKLETFRTAEAEAGEGIPAGDAARSQAEDGKVYISRLVSWVIEGMGAEETFGISAVTAEVNRRYKDRLPQPVEPGQVSVVLRWMLRTGRLRSVQKGRPFHEALYKKP